MSENNSILRQLQLTWRDTSAAARLGMIVTLLICFALIAGVGYWSAQPHYVPLANQLSPTMAAEIVSRLDENDIPNKLNFSGSGVLVDQSHWNQAQLLIGDVVEPNQVATGLMNNSIMSDPTTKDARLLRELEMRLAATLSKLHPIEQAWVHLGAPSAEPFLRDQTEKTASVIVRLRPGTSFSRHLIRSIAVMIANSVDRLEQENVSISDSNGRTFTGEGSEFGGAVSSQLEYRQRLERDLADKAESMLTSLLGPGKAVVRVTADVDFTSATVEKISFDPDNKVKIQETIESKTDTQDNGLAAGAAGSASNIGGASGRRSNGKAVTSQFEKNTTSYENTKIEEKTNQQPGEIRRLTVAATVQLETAVSAEKTAAGPPAAPENSISPEKVEAIIKRAVGFDSSRNDEIEVLIAPLIGQLPLEELVAAPPATLDMWAPILRNASLGIAALVALVLGLVTLKRIRPVAYTPAAHVTPQRARQISDLVTLVRQHPDLVTNIMSAWVKDSEESAAEDTAPADQTARAA